MSSPRFVMKDKSGVLAGDFTTLFSLHAIKDSMDANSSSTTTRSSAAISVSSSSSAASVFTVLAVSTRCLLSIFRLSFASGNILAFISSKLLLRSFRVFGASFEPNTVVECSFTLLRFAAPASSTSTSFDRLCGFFAPSRSKCHILGGSLDSSTFDCSSFFERRLTVRCLRLS